MTPSDIAFAMAIAATVWVLIYWGWACATS